MFPILSMLTLKINFHHRRPQYFFSLSWEWAIWSLHGQLIHPPLIPDRHQLGTNTQAFSSFFVSLVALDTSWWLYKHPSSFRGPPHHCCNSGGLALGMTTPDKLSLSGKTSRPHEPSLILFIYSYSLRLRGECFLWWTRRRLVIGVPVRLWFVLVIGGPRSCDAIVKNYSFSLARQKHAMPFSGYIISPLSSP